MAVQPKEINKKSSSKKLPLKKRRRKKTSKKSTFKKSLLIVLGVFAMISMVAFGYYLGQENRPTQPTVKTSTHKKDGTKTQKKLLKDLATLKIKKPKQIEEKKAKKKDIPKSAIKKNPTVHLENVAGKPKLVIIIDDVSSRRQLKNIQALHMKITPSIFPPSERSMTSHTLARGLKHYMIHLPMESGSKQFNTQYKTLKTSFSKEQITARVKELRKLFPKAQYINNHTGSVFTDNYTSMLTLYTELKKEGFMFLDSRTIASTKVPKIVKKFGDAYVYRDIFIDNVHNIPMIHKQLKKAVALAKKKGYAIAIGHPHAITMKALSRAGAILEEVELIYIDDLMTI